MAPDAPAYLVRKVYALLGAAHISERADKLRLFRWILHDPSIMSTNDLNQAELEGIAATLAGWQRQGELESRAREASSIGTDY